MIRYTQHSELLMAYQTQYRAKNLDQSHAYWFLAVEGGRFNRVLLRTLRNKDTLVSERLCKAVSDKSLRQRD